MSGGQYAFTFDEAPYFEADGTVHRAATRGNRAPAIRTRFGDGRWPEDYHATAPVFELVPDGPLGTKRWLADLSGMPDAMKLGGRYPGEVLLDNWEFFPLEGMAGLCVGGGKYIVSCDVQGYDTLMHEIGHALGLTNNTIDTNDGLNHCEDVSCTMFYADIPNDSPIFHGGTAPPKNTCAHWLRRLNMTKDHLYERWWSKGGWPEHMSESDANGCPCTGGMLWEDPPGLTP